MKDNTEAATGGATNVNQTATSGASKTQTESTSGDEASKSYPAQFVDKLKKEKENQSKSLNELKEQIARLEADKAQKEEQELAKREEFRKLWESEKAKHQGTVSELATLKNKMLEARKMAAVKTELNKLGLRSEYQDAAFKLMEVGSMVFDESTGTVIGAEDKAKDFYDKYNALGFFGKSAPGVDQRAPSPNGKMGLANLSLKDKIKLLAELQNKK